MKKNMAKFWVTGSLFALLMVLEVSAQPIMGWHRSGTDFVKGEIVVSGVEDNSIVSVVTKEGKTYVLTSEVPVPMKGEWYRPEFCCSGHGSYGRHHHGVRYGHHYGFYGAQNQRNYVSMSELAAFKGKSVTLMGKINTDSKVMCIFDFVVD